MFSKLMDLDPPTAILLVAAAILQILAIAVFA